MNDQHLKTNNLPFRSIDGLAVPASDMSPLNGPSSSDSASSQQSKDYTEYSQIYRKFHQHTISDSTSNTDSTHSSPTTVYSNVDDSSATEPSPDSSPESPPPATFAIGMLRPRTAGDSRSPFFELQKQPPPPKKGRNLKNLAVNTSRPPLRAAVTTQPPVADATASDHHNSILSPAFVKPPTPPRRRTNNLGLTILTPSVQQSGLQDGSLAIPPTPAGLSRPNTLRHFQSSPSLPLVTNFGFNQLPAKDRRRPPALNTLLSPVEPPVSQQVPEVEELEEQEEQNFDIPLSREEKPEAYPTGPLTIYEPNIDLYLEPTAEQAMQYDVIMNVASEVRNPFESYSEPDPTKDQLRIDGGGGIQLAPRRDHLTIKESTPQAQDASPTTPKATPLNSPTLLTYAGSGLYGKQPEYLHIKWEHNSDIVPDLLRLVKLIDERSQAGKRVLVHCQCGVSRSASLLVAYGLYRDPSMSVQDAYNAVKKRSKWIGPNMNLIMQLQEFRSSLARGGVLSPDRNLSPTTPQSAAGEWNHPFSDHPRLPMTAIAPAIAEIKSVEDLAAISGPSSAPSGFPWPGSEPSVPATEISKDTIQSTSTYIDPAGHVVPVLNLIATDSPAIEHPNVETPVSEKDNSATPTPTEKPHQRTSIAMAPVIPSADANPFDEFGILSPTSTEFATSPWDRSALLASLGMGPMSKDEETPRRSLQMQQRPTHLVAQDAESIQRSDKRSPLRKLRPRISSPTLREQKQLQSLQAQIEATLPIRNTPAAQLKTVDEALMSPRATEFTDNPFAFPTPTAIAPAVDKTPAKDPRSPAQKGASPIIRSIFDFL